ncbi:YgdI/YgdR family lipoprotein [Algoriphagus halophytocola]|uniref:YgdI/YgdR family lipoprotein n=1 Tax=Algoriphagus halophytocola TaxID=2991499 RepID=A0ABY6MLN4_9BACT|nr:YgdI/YgdR family lipoprotein [Algoriphagus sp. TR-M5]UZD24454.1 YgdI/YgdR family lipoprotein [Algoriphagus sp. TR-M5]
MKKAFPIVFLILSGCGLLEDTKLVDILDVDGPCTILLADGTTVTSSGNIEISKRTQAITYRDEDGKIWSLFKDDYQSYSCQE